MTTITFIFKCTQNPLFAAATLVWQKGGKEKNKTKQTTEWNKKKLTETQQTNKQQRKCPSGRLGQSDL